MSHIKKPMAGSGYVILNVIRVMNIICLLAVVAASSVMLVKTLVISRFFFFDAVTHVVVACISLFLIISELNIFREYFSRNWPLLSQSSGFVTLGTTKILLGVSTLGNLNEQAMSQKSLGLAFWRIVIAAGIIAVFVGVINLIANFVFRDSKLGVTARQVRARGAVATQEAVTRTSSYKSFQLGSKDSLPTHRSSTSSSRSMSMRHTPRFPIKISSPITDGPEQFPKSPSTPDLTVPNLAHHPAMYSNRV